MENFFNEIIAARLQYFTFPLELTGLTLALIEVRFPKTAEYLTRQVERLSQPMKELRSGSQSMAEKSLGILLSRILTTGLGVLTAVYLVQLIFALARGGLGEGWLVSLIVSYVVAAIIVTIVLVIVGLTAFFLVIGGTDFAHRFVAGRAIGTLGIIIAGLGLLGELYQLITQLVH